MLIAQLSQAKRTEIKIVPLRLAHIESNKQCFLNFLSESTPSCWRKTFLFVCDRIGQIYTEGFSSQSLTEQLEGATEVKTASASDMT